jgi:hypothetical protein
MSIYKKDNYSEPQKYEVRISIIKAAEMVYMQGTEQEICR